MKVLLLLLIPSLTFAFTLNNTAWFSNPEIHIEIANTNCDAAGMNTAKFKKLLERAVDDFWNSVPTSALKLKVGSIGSKDISGMTMESIINATDNKTILAGCSDAIDGFDGSSEPSGVSGILGVGTISCNGSDCRGAFVLNSHATSQVSLLSDSDIAATIAHELGHTIGLGHSEYKHNLMYYSIGGKKQKWLGEDDIDGINYLYPHASQLGGLLGSCGTISKSKDDSPPGNPFIFSFAIGLGLLLLLNSIIRSKT